MNNLKEPIATKLITQKKVSALAAPKKTIKKTVSKLAESKPKVSKPKITKKVSTSPNISEKDRQQMIAENAYYRAQRRDFNPDGIEADWLEAEAEINQRLV